MERVLVNRDIDGARSHQSKLPVVVCEMGERPAISTDRDVMEVVMSWRHRQALAIFGVPGPWTLAFNYQVKPSSSKLRIHHQT